MTSQEKKCIESASGLNYLNMLFLLCIIVSTRFGTGDDYVIPIATLSFFITVIVTTWNLSKVHNAKDEK